MNAYQKKPETVIAKKWVELADDGFMTEGLCFDRTGEKLWFVSVYDGMLLCLDMKTKKHAVVYRSPGDVFGAVKVHRDGRLFVCSLGDLTQGGAIFAIDPDGGNREDIVCAEEGFLVDDLAFDEDGSIFFTDLKGDVCDRTGGVYRVTPDYLNTEPFLVNLASPNGLAFSKDHTRLWVTEMNENRLLCATRTPAGRKASVNVACTFQGMHGPDSCCVDDKGNVWIAMHGQGRVVACTKEGVFVRQILFPESEQDHEMNCATVAMMPDGEHMVIGATDKETGIVALYQVSAL